MERITLDNLAVVEPNQLKVDKYFELFEVFVMELESQEEPEDAKNALLILGDLINKTNDEKLLAKYLPLLSALRLISLNLFNDREKERLFNENLVLLASQSYADLDYWVKRLFNLYIFDDETKRQLKNILSRTFETNLNLLGDSNITINKNTVKPFVKNWIADYNSYPTNKIQKGPLEETSYINQSANTSKLSPEKLSTLRNILKVYDWIRFQSNTNVSAVNTFDQKSGAKRNVDDKILQAIKKGEDRRVQGVTIDNLKKEIQKAPTGLTELEKKYAAQTPANQIPTRPHIPPPKLITPQPSKPAQPKPDLKQILDTPELPPHREQPAKPQQKPMQPQPLPTKSGNSQNINNLQDLKSINVHHLRTGNLITATEGIKHKIMEHARQNRIMPYEAVNVFEQSPLFKLYLRTGGMLIGNTNPDRKAAFAEVAAKLKAERLNPLTLEEFEAVADLKKEIEKL